MPQLFFFIEELSFVDWDTVVIYTCQNSKCIPHGESIVVEE